MRAPFRALRLVPAIPAFSRECLREVLRAPPVDVLPVTDDIGVQYAFDLQLTAGFYLLLLTYLALKIGIGWINDSRDRNSRRG